MLRSPEEACQEGREEVTHSKPPPREWQGQLGSTGKMFKFILFYSLPHKLTDN